MSKNFETFALRFDIEMKATRIVKRPDLTSVNDPWYFRADHFKCVFTRKGKQMTAYFSQGEGFKGEPPTIGRVLESIHLDATSVDNVSFEEWAQGFGYDPDSRKAERLYRACKRSARKMERFLHDRDCCLSSAIFRRFMEVEA